MMAGQFDSMSTDELWAFHEELAQALAARLASEKAALEVRLDQLQRSSGRRQAKLNGKRSYPPVAPKYRNPGDASETWSGRGKKPRWLVAQLKMGRQIDDFLIRSKTGPMSSKASRGSRPTSAFRTKSEIA
jgi:DNA-binding protein H-NS